MSEDLFSAEECEKLGILPLSVTDHTIEVGAMNPEMEEIQNFIRNLYQKTNYYY